MCGPLAVMAAMTVASTVAQTYQQKQAANAQDDANKRQYDATMQAYANNVNQTNLMQSQEHDAAVAKMTENNMAAQKAMSTAAVSAGESGVSGLSVDALLSDLAGQRDRYNDSVEHNYQNASMAIANQRQNVHANAASQINQLRTPQQPDYIGAGLRIGQAVYGYNNPKIKAN